MDFAGRCKSGTFHVPAFLSVYNPKPTRTKIYFPDSHVGSLDVSLLEREERSAEVLHQFHTKVAPHYNRGIGKQVPSAITNSRRSNIQTASYQAQASLIKGITNQLAHEIHEEDASRSTTKTVQPQNSCKVDSGHFSDTNQETQVQVQQNQEMSFSCGLVEENEIAKQDPEVCSLHDSKGLDQLPCKYKTGSRANAWKGPSYTDLITAAIMSTEDRKMTVSQIYDWLMQAIPYFKDREHYESYRGWKNAVRHTLSLRRRFVKLPRTNTCSPWYNSWWTISEKHFAHKRPGRKAKAKS